MAQRALGVLVLNLSCEMLYVIDERLIAQGVPRSKATKVLLDMSKAMFDSNFIDTLLKPQPMYSQSNLRTIFDHLSRASIMRLNSESMSKVSISIKALHGERYSILVFAAL
jgi:hypothetical protein